MPFIAGLPALHIIAQHLKNERLHTFKRFSFTYFFQKKEFITKYALSLVNEMKNNNFYDNCMSPATIFINILEEFILIISNSRDLK